MARRPLLRLRHRTGRSVVRHLKPGYFTLYRTHGIELLRRRGALASDHPDPVAMTWALSFESIEKANPAAAELLRICAFLSPDGIPEKVFSEGAREPDVAKSLNNLAKLYFSQGQYAKAEPLYERALAIWEEALGAEHPTVATCLEKYASLLREIGRPEDAAPLESRAMAIRAKHA